MIPTEHQELWVDADDAPDILQPDQYLIQLMCVIGDAVSVQTRGKFIPCAAVRPTVPRAQSVHDGLARVMVWSSAASAASSAELSVASSEGFW